MMDDFCNKEPLSGVYSNGTPSGLMSSIFEFIRAAPFATFVSAALIPLLILTVTRLRSGYPSLKAAGKEGRNVWMLPYWVPFIGHGFQFLTDPIKLMSEARDLSPHGIFALNLGATTHNIISDPSLVKGVMQQRESVIQFRPIAWGVVQRFFGIPKRSKAKYWKSWEILNSTYSEYLMKEPHLGNMLQGTIRGLQENIPQMITFAEAEIDQQPWERWAKVDYVSDSVSEINLMSLMRDMMGYASIPGMFGRGLIEKYPDILHDIYDMDAGFTYFLMGLPALTPWPGVFKAHHARQKVHRAVDDQQRALDALGQGKPFDSTWGDLDDVSELILKRNALFREEGFEIAERGEITVLWALVVNANLLVYWLILHILATPGLVDRIRKETAPYVEVTKPVSIGKFSGPPTLKLSQEELAKKCPLFKSAYFEALRISDQPWSVREVTIDVVISGDKTAADPANFVLHKGEYVTIPHDLHMRDPKYFKDPERFDPERFIVRDEDGTLSAEIGTIRPYGGGPSMCKGRVFAERECLSLVAGVLALWDIEPADEKAGWVIPKQKKASALSLPAKDTRVRISRRKFEWDEQTTVADEGGK